MNFENLTFDFNASLLNLIPIIIFGIGYTYFVYRFTIPHTSKLIKTTLIFLRSFTLILIISLLFEPSINLSYNSTVNPVNLLFLDNSSSMVNKDSLNRSKLTHSFISDYRNNVQANIEYFTFGKNVAPIIVNNNLRLIFNEPITNFDNIVNSIKTDKNISSITILSDGIFNEGTNSYSNFEKLNIPIFTIAIGDTTRPSDVSIMKASYNKLIYVNKTTEIKSVIRNTNLAGRKIFATLYDNNGIVESKKIKLNENGINTISFNYRPQIVGKQSLILKTSQLNEEENLENNNYPLIIDVLDNKINVLLIAGSPSPDLSILTQSLLKNNNIKLSKIIQFSPTKFFGKENSKAILDSADIIMMLDFPTIETPLKLLNDVAEKIGSDQKPFFLILSQSTDYKKLSKFDSFLPFTIPKISRNKILVQPKIKSLNNTLIRNTLGWGKLPPIYMNNSELELRSGTVIIAVGDNKGLNLEIPLIFSRNIASSRSIVLNGFNFWKWNLQSDNSIENLFHTFTSDIIKWLFADNNQERVFVTSNKDIYNSNESVVFIGNAYDETLSPRNDAIFNININSIGYEKSLKLIPTQNGKYEGTINISQSGEFNYSAKISIPGESEKSINGKFIISKKNIENNNFVLNSNYLKFISNITSGKSFNIKNYSDVFNKINSLSERQTKNNIIKTKYSIWANEWILIILILFISVEWIIRKKKGML